MKNNTYELELVPIKVNDTRIELWTVKRWKDVVETEDEDAKKYITHFPLWIKIWEASIVLCEYLSQFDLGTDKQILELGAGIGLTGMVLGASGHQITLTDYDDDALMLLEKNARHNKLNNVQVKKLDWLRPDIDTAYDIVIGSELVYKKEFNKPLFNIFKTCVKPNGTIYIAHDMVRKTMASFLTIAEKKFTIQSTAKILTTDGGHHRIAIHTLRFK